MLTVHEDVVIADDGSNIVKIYSPQEWITALVKLKSHPGFVQYAVKYGRHLPGLESSIFSVPHMRLSPLIKKDGYARMHYEKFPDLKWSFDVIMHQYHEDMIYADRLQKPGHVDGIVRQGLLMNNIEVLNIMGYHLLHLGEFLI